VDADIAIDTIKLIAAISSWCDGSCGILELRVVYLVHPEGFEPNLSSCTASFSAHSAIIDLRDSVVNHFDIALVCTFVCTLVL
jgi:hypothetical protein